MIFIKAICFGSEIVCTCTLTHIIFFIIIKTYSIKYSYLKKNKYSVTHTSSNSGKIWSKKKASFSSLCSFFKKMRWELFFIIFGSKINSLRVWHFEMLIYPIKKKIIFLRIRLSKCDGLIVILFITNSLLIALIKT